MTAALRIAPLRSGGLRISLATKRNLYRALLLTLFAAVFLWATVHSIIHLARNKHSLVLIATILCAIATATVSFFALRECVRARTHVDVKNGQFRAVYGIYRIKVAAASVAAVEADPQMPDLPGFSPGVRVTTLSGAQILVFPGLPDTDRENAARVLREELGIACSA